jgi:hypothetical protein
MNKIYLSLQENRKNDKTTPFNPTSPEALRPFLRGTSITNLCFWIKWINSDFLKFYYLGTLRKIYISNEKLLRS